jgi:pyruvate formate lyase activating enzyme
MKSAVNKPIDSISPFTLLDYPDHTACIIWFTSCNMRCEYCYNPHLVLGKGKMTYDEALIFLKKRVGLLDGVVLSGGECTLAKGFIDFVRNVKELGFLIKVDTNGSTPSAIVDLVKENLLDFVSLDFKAPKSSFFSLTKSKLFHRFERTLQFLCQSDITFEVRTTYHSDLLNSEDLNEMKTYLKTAGYPGDYYIQHTLNDAQTLGHVTLPTQRITVSDFRDADRVIIRS